ncbi:unnamed protein product [Lepeophtheirus salmonis]|uniref:(salmon louse) hypothetical protein n=1 Tax=Lepeophtheirus salmonis TaxID=72036 RepID=A0A7R8HCG1_LEPSM|nr:unnamed protein product [Lepeophtheirus salmonis]CAF3014955.1 unnamed protein product [Lepeophtheirus salmonis]
MSTSSPSLSRQNRRKSSIVDPVEMDQPPLMEQTWGNAILKAILSFIGLFVLLSLYIGLGAYLFVWIEGPLEEERYQDMMKKGQEVDLNIDFISQYLTRLNYDLKDSNFNCYDRIMASPYRGPRTQFANSKCFRFTVEEMRINGTDPFCQCLYSYKKTFEISASRMIKQFTWLIVKAINEHDYAIDINNTYIWNWDWTYPNSLLFTMTTLTLIGYGHIAPSTEMSQMTLMIYVVLGLPIMMLFLGNIGGSLAEVTKFIYSRCCCRWCRVRRKVEEEEEPLVSLRKDVYGIEDYMPSNEVLVPIVITLLLMSLYIVAGAAVYSSWEGWSLMDASYFSFITLTTIGFGDFVPGKSFLSEDSDLFKIFRILFTSLYCLIGLALISTGLSLMQEHIVNKTQWAASKLGLRDDEEGLGNEDKIIISLSVGAKETPGFDSRNEKKKKSYFDFDDVITNP